MESLTGRVALVTGGGRGIGRAIALALARAGCDVAVGYRQRQEDADSAAREIREAGRRSAAIRADVSRGSDVSKLALAVESQLGPIDILVNNAGALRVQKLEEIREEDWNEMIAVNLTSCFLMTQAALPGMRARRWGRIINLSSVAGQTGSVFGLHYSAAKAGMIGLTRSYARLLVKEGITVNAISPALIATEMVTASPAIKPDLIPMGRFGELEEVAEVAVMLAGNAFITGQTLGVNGGLYLG
ncbi:MAG TPA: 3-oxoacyl-ACP reductase FabG [Bryobacteraceae bacterium]|nr:3-oxoacyl-ACP reductase FabG [Bryobacteraceae bacterium]